MSCARPRCPQAQPHRSSSFRYLPCCLSSSFSGQYGVQRNRGQLSSLHHSQVWPRTSDQSSLLLGHSGVLPAGSSPPAAYTLATYPLQRISGSLSISMEQCTITSSAFETVRIPHALYVETGRRGHRKEQADNS